MMMRQNKRLYNYCLLIVLASISVVLNGCSTGYQRPVQRNLPAIPEIQPREPIRPTYSPPPKSNVKPYAPTVQKYGVSSPDLNDSVITQKDVATVTQESIIENARNSARVDDDPYAAIPESKTTETVTTQTGSSPAVKSLLIRAQADLAIGRSESAISKLERGLRIESQNPKLWNVLAQAHYDQSDYQQAISMSKKSIRYSNDDDLIAKNWALIKKAGLKSGDTTVVKEAINYFKINP